jgi:hypothetical protein
MFMNIITQAKSSVLAKLEATISIALQGYFCTTGRNNQDNVGKSSIKIFLLYQRE